MQYQRFDHTLTLKMTSDMRDDIDRALILVQDTLIRTRSEFIRAACQYAIDSLVGGCGDIPVHQSTRAGESRPAVRYRRGARGEETGRSRRF